LGDPRGKSAGAAVELTGNVAQSALHREPPTQRLNAA